MLRTVQCIYVYIYNIYIYMYINLRGRPPTGSTRNHFGCLWEPVLKHTGTILAHFGHLMAPLWHLLKLLGHQFGPQGRQSSLQGSKKRKTCLPRGSILEPKMTKKWIRATCKSKRFARDVSPNTPPGPPRSQPQRALVREACLWEL